MLPFSCLPSQPFRALGHQSREGRAVIILEVELPNELLNDGYPIELAGYIDIQSRVVKRNDLTGVGISGYLRH